MRAPAIAVFRPRRGDVALMFGRGLEIDSQALPVDAARDLHRSLGEALRLAGCKAHPMAAVGEPAK